MPESEYSTEDILAAFMARKRSRLIVEIELDPVPGWGNVPEDHRALIARLLADAVPHYNPTVTLDGDGVA